MFTTLELQPRETLLCTLVELALQPKGRLMQAAEIASKCGVPCPSVQNALLSLRRLGLVRGERGPSGGYALSRSAAEISVRDVFPRAETPYPANLPACRAAVREWMIGVGTLVIERASRTTVADLAKRTKELSDATAIMPGL